MPSRRSIGTLRISKFRMKPALSPPPREVSPTFRAVGLMRSHHSEIERTQPELVRLNQARRRRSFQNQL
jgi:hypothetical protein